MAERRSIALTSVRHRVLGRMSPTKPLGKWLRLANLRLRPVTRNGMIHRLALTTPSVRFIQIGANDGLVADPLHDFIERFSWTGALVEPQPFVFTEHLEPRYRANSRIQLVNAAIGEASGVMPLFVFSFSTERWATGKASLRREVLESMIRSGSIESLAREKGVALPADEAEWIATIDVPILTVAELVNRTGLDSVDLVHVDTEGADGMILRQFPADMLGAKIVQFEHQHLDPADFALTCAHLASGGFELYRDSMDVIAVRNVRVGRTTLEPLTAPWELRN